MSTNPHTAQRLLALVDALSDPADELPPADDACPACEGQGVVSVDVEVGHRTIDVDHDCRACRGTGREL